MIRVVKSIGMTGVVYLLAMSSLVWTGYYYPGVINWMLDWFHQVPNKIQDDFKVSSGVMVWLRMLFHSTSLILLAYLLLWRLGFLALGYRPGKKGFLAAGTQVMGIFTLAHIVGLVLLITLAMTAPALMDASMRFGGNIARWVNTNVTAWFGQGVGLAARLIFVDKMVVAALSMFAARALFSLVWK